MGSSLCYLFEESGFSETLHRLGGPPAPRADTRVEPTRADE